MPRRWPPDPTSTPSRRRRFDGVVGVLGGLEAIRALRAAGVRPRRPVELIMFTAEEPTRFALGCLGSRILAGVVGRERLAALRDAGGMSLDEARAAAGVGGDLRGARLAPGAYAAFVELHIDCVFMATICPAAMIFVPSAGGVSHRPDEYTSSLEIAQGAQVLAGALRRLAA